MGLQNAFGLLFPAEIDEAWLVNVSIKLPEIFVLIPPKLGLHDLSVLNVLLHLIYFLLFKIIRITLYYLNLFKILV